MACAWLLQPAPPQVVVALLPLPLVVQVQVQLSYALITKLPCRPTGAWVEIGAGAINGGFKGTSWVPFQQICCPTVKPTPLLTCWPCNPIKFCLLVTRTHLNARALAPFS